MDSASNSTLKSTLENCGFQLLGIIYDLWQARSTSCSAWVTHVYTILGTLMHVQLKIVYLKEKEMKV